MEDPLSGLRNVMLSVRSVEESQVEDRLDAFNGSPICVIAAIRYDIEFDGGVWIGEEGKKKTASGNITDHAACSPTLSNPYRWPLAPR
jgi:hypothetical protein